MSEKLKRVLIAVGIGLAVAVITNFVEVGIAHLALNPTATILDDALIGLGACLCAYAWAALLAERETRRHMKIKQEATIRERTRIACEIHDVLAQSFAGMIYNIEAVHESLPDTSQERGLCQRALRIAREGLAESRRLVRTVRSPLPSAEDLRVAVTELVQLLTEGEELRTNCNIVGDFTVLSPEIEGQLLRILREAVTNVVKHAKASDLAVDLRLEGDSVQLGIEDNGLGFVPERSTTGETFGLTSMQERAHDLGGVLSIDSKPGNGARIVASIPISQQIEQEYSRGNRARATSA